MFLMQPLLLYHVFNIVARSFCSSIVFEHPNNFDVRSLCVIQLISELCEEMTFVVTAVIQWNGNATSNGKATINATVMQH